MENYHILFSDGSSGSPLGNRQSYSQAANDVENLNAKVDVSGNRKVVKAEHKTGMVKKHKYAFQTRSQVDILDDGYRWRKYGQKTVKNTKFPRFIYIFSLMIKFYFSSEQISVFDL